MARWCSSAFDPIGRFSLRSVQTTQVNTRFDLAPCPVGCLPVGAFALSRVLFVVPVADGFSVNPALDLWESRFRLACVSGIDCRDAGGRSCLQGLEERTRGSADMGRTMLALGRNRLFDRCCRAKADSYRRLSKPAAVTLGKSSVRASVAVGGASRTTGALA